MTFTAALASLYAVSGILGCACYVPQILRLARSPEARRAMALATWGGWLALGTITLVYAIHLGTAEMVLVNGLNSACQIVVVGLVVAQRLADRRGQRQKGRPPQAPAPVIRS
jgi:hypothetical protein